VLQLDVDEIESTVALDQLVGFAKKRGELFFVLWMSVQFGGDISNERYKTLYHDLLAGTVEQPPIRIRRPGVMHGFLGAYNRRTRTIEVDRETARAASQGDPSASWLLLLILIEEFGHYLDHLLRGDDGDAPGDEGARFAYSLLNLGWTQQTSFEYGIYHHKKNRSSSPLVVSWVKYRARLDELAGSDEQDADDQDVEREYFGAGRLDHDHDSHSWGHQAIEEAVLRASNVNPDAVLQIYFGNWLRDYSQALGGFLERKLGRDLIISVLYYMAHGEFGQSFDFNVTPERLGTYYYWEHIDNPYGTAQAKPHCDRFEQTTWLPVYVRSSANFWDPPPLRTPSNQIPSSLGYLCQQLQEAVRLGDNVDGRRALGQALHVIEDYYAHSNFVELTLIRCAQIDPEHFGHCANVYPWTDYRIPGEDVPPIITGTYGNLDTAISLVLILAEHLAAAHECEFYTNEPSWKLKAAITLVGEILQGRLVPVEAPDAIKELWNKHVDELQLALHWASELGLFSYKPLANALTTFDEHAAAFLQCEAVKALSKFGSAVLAVVVRHLVRQAIGRDINFDGRAASIVQSVGTTLERLQTVVGGVGMYPTHSQLAKDHAHHPMHELAARMATIAVKHIYDTVAEQWRQPATARAAAQAAAPSCQVAAGYLVHPFKSSTPRTLMDAARAWARRKRNRRKIARAASPRWRKNYRHRWNRARDSIRRIIGEAVGHENVDSFIQMVEEWLRHGHHEGEVYREGDS
jgi:hypothetical protein